MPDEAHARVLDTGHASEGPTKEDAWARGVWSEDEDDLLLKIVRTQAPTDWVKVSEFVSTRSPEQCRERYLQNLNSESCHDPMSLEEGKVIEDLMKIARFSGCSSNAVENWVNYQNYESVDSGYSSLNTSPCALQSHDPTSKKKSGGLNPRKPRLSKAVRHRPGGACADCRRKKTKCLHRLTNLPTPEHGSDARTESDSSDNPPSPSPENDTWLTLAYAKHQMMVSLMRDVYAIFNPQWKADVRSRTGSQAASTGASSQESSSRTPSSTAGGKRRMQNRGSPPPNANEKKKKKKKIREIWRRWPRTLVCVLLP